MKIKILFAGLLTLTLFTAGYAQTPDKSKLDQFFDRLAEKNKAMGQSALPLEATAQDKFRIESAGLVFEFDTAKNQMIQKRDGRGRVFTKENNC